MKQINFIFTKNGFHIDETKEEKEIVTRFMKLKKHD